MLLKTPVRNIWRAQLFTSKDGVRFNTRAWEHFRKTVSSKQSLFVNACILFLFWLHSAEPFQNQGCKKILSPSPFQMNVNSRTVTGSSAFLVYK